MISSDIITIASLALGAVSLMIATHIYVRAERYRVDAMRWRRHSRRMSNAAKWGAHLRRQRIDQTTAQLRQEIGL